MTKMIKETKVQDIGGSMTTTIPSIIRDTHHIKKGDTVRWIIDFSTSPPSISFKNIKPSD